MSIIQFFRILWARRWIIVVATIACFAAGIIALFILPKTYTSTARVMLDVSRPDMLTGEAIQPAFAKAYVPSEAEFISSNRVSARAAENLGWTRDPQLRAEYDAYAANEANKNNVVGFRYWLARRISGNITSQQYMATNVIEITYAANDPQVAAQMANAVRQAYADESIASKRADASQAVAWLDRQMGEISKQREAAEQRVVAYQRANGIVLVPGGNDTDSSQLAAIAAQAPSSGSMTVGGMAGNPNAGTIASIDARIASESASLGPNHPIIQDLRKQRAALLSAPVPTGPTVINGPSREAVMAAQGAKVLAQQNKVGEAKRLQSEVDVLTAQYNLMASRAAGLRQQINTNSFSVVMMDPATPPRGPESPKTPLVLFGSLGFGFFLGVLIALVVEFMRRRVRGVEDLVSATNVPVIAVINAPPALLAAA